MIHKIKFQNYKAFKGYEEIELRPITLIIGKNSSGKSSVLKLFPMFSALMTGSYKTPMLHVNGISYGGTYTDLFHNRSNSGLLFGIELDNESAKGLSVDVEYYMDGEQLQIYKYRATYGESVIEKGREEDFSLIDGFVSKDFFSENNLTWILSLHNMLDYIGPLRIKAPSCIRFEGIPYDSKIGYDGKEAYQILLNSYKTDGKLFNNVSSWMEQHLDGQKITFSNTANNSGNYTLWINRRGTEVNISEVGQGIAQVLPIVTMAMKVRKKSVNIIEQPELHLHPAAHADVAELIANMSLKSNAKFVVESHSKNLLLGFQKLVVNKKNSFKPSDIAIYFIDETDEGSSIRRINMDESGDFDNWPVGVFDDTSDLYKEINRMLS